MYFRWNILNPPGLTEGVLPEGSTADKGGTGHHRGGFFATSEKAILLTCPFETLLSVPHETHMSRKAHIPRT